MRYQSSRIIALLCILLCSLYTLGSYRLISVETNIFDPVTPRATSSDHAQIFLPGKEIRKGVGSVLGLTVLVMRKHIQHRHTI